jgi:hypothetical protein
MLHIVSQDGTRIQPYDGVTMIPEDNDGYTGRYKAVVNCEPIGIYTGMSKAQEVINMIAITLLNSDSSVAVFKMPKDKDVEIKG